MLKDDIAGITSTSFGSLPDGRETTLYRVEGPDGMVMVVADYGAIITSLLVPSPDGDFRDVVLGFEDLDSYLRGSSYFGAAIGRYGNRIRAGRFSLDGKVFELATNDGANHLHGGRVGFDRVLWDTEPFSEKYARGIRFCYVSPDGEEGFPGELAVHMTYTLSSDYKLTIDYEATTDAPTPVNLTHHSYFNLGEAGNTILGHELMIAADAFTPVDAGLIPTGEIRDVAGTPFDFRTPAAIGARIDNADEQLALAGGYDHNFVLAKPGNGLRLVATLREPDSGWTMEVLTTEPGLQFYSGNFLDGSLLGKGGRVYDYRTGLCLESQHFPDSPNRPEFPSTILRPGETYSSQTVFRFGPRVS